jgi:PTH1 family peptidyl-tRNA hydrolase
MKLIVGLGNPGSSYQKTRHNVGFMVVDALASALDLNFSNNQKFKSQMATGQLGEEKVIILKPETFMNLSGDSVSLAANFYKIDPKDIVVIHDDLDVDLGTTKIRAGGSSAGQKGVQSVIERVGTKDFYRFRVGIRPQEGQKIPAEDFVLGKFTPSELGLIKENIPDIVQKIIQSIRTGTVIESIK